MLEKTIAHYEVLDEIGAGGMGVVWEEVEDRRFLVMELVEVRSRDPLYTKAYGEILKGSGVEPLKLPARSLGLSIVPYAVTVISNE